MAEAVLAAFNKRASTKFRSPSWLKMIGTCLLAFPELDLEEHVAMIERNFANPWWTTTAPSVLFASIETFERALHNGHKVPRKPVYNKVPRDHDPYTKV